MAIPRSILTLLVGIALTLISLWVGRNHGLMPEAASTDAPLIDGLFDTMITIATGLFLIVQGVLIYAVWRFRRRPGETGDPEPVEGNLALEALWTAIPVVIVFGLAIYSFDVYQRMGGLSVGHGGGHSHHHAEMADMAMASPRISAGLGEAQGNAPALTVDVKGLQFAWLFTYPEAGIVSGELHLPVNQEVLLNIEAMDVIHSFWVPQFRLKQDAIPGERTQLRFQPTKTGTYPVVCAELCGSYHGGMRTSVIVQTPEEYQTWLQDQIAQQTASLPVTPNRLERAVAAHGLGVDPHHLHHPGPEHLAQLSVRTAS